MLGLTLRRFSEASVLTSHHNSVCRVQLNRPKALNSLDLPMIRLLQQQVDKWNASPTTRVAMFLGAGSKSFCAGGDIRALYTAKQDNTDISLLRDFFWYEYLVDHALAVMTPIQVAIYDGIVMGGGVGISIHAPIRVATESAIFAMPETAIGFFPDVGASYFLPRLKHHLGVYFGLTGSRLVGQQLVSAGIATHFVPKDRTNELKESLIAKVTATSTLADVTKIVEEVSVPVTEPLANLENIEKTFGNAISVEQIFNYLEKKEGDWEKKKLTALQTASPLSLKVVFEQLKRGGQLSLAECFKQEFRLSQRFMTGNDFFEGIRANLIDKDQKPKWEYKSVFDVPEAVVMSCFEKVTPEQEDLPLS